MIVTDDFGVKSLMLLKYNLVYIYGLSAVDCSATNSTRSFFLEQITKHSKEW